MDRAGFKARRQAFESGVLPTKHYFTYGVVVRQHADNNITIEQIGEVRRRLETDCRKLGRLLWATDICDDLETTGGKICGHCCAHMAKSDEANSLCRRMAT